MFNFSTIRQLLLWVLLLYSLSALAQQSSYRITLNAKSETLQTVFSEIEKQSGLVIFYSNVNLNGQEKVSITVVNEQLNKVMEKLLKDKPLQFEIQQKYIVITSKKNRQPAVLPPTATNDSHTPVQDRYLVTGKVADVDGKPLNSANIQLKGSTRGTTTDVNGTFSIEAEKGDIIIVSSLGYETQEIKTIGLPLNIMMKIKTNPLEDVVVVGYGQQKRSAITSAISKVTAEELVSQPAANLGTVLAGRINGAIVTSASGRPGDESPWIFIRGVNFTQQPLIVIDGVPKYGGINGGPTGSALLGLGIKDINPDEVESVSILKDNAATAVYGARGAFGVILITTKRGKISKPSFSYLSNFSWNQPTMLPKRLDAYTYALAQNERSINDGGTAIYSPAQLDAIKDQTDPYQYANTDWYNVLIQRTAMEQSHSLSVSGGNEAIKFYINGSYLDQRGVVDAYSYKRYTLNSNFDIKLHKNLTLSTNLSLRNGTMNGAGGTQAPAVFGAVLSTSPIQPVYNKDGSFYGINDFNNPLIGTLPSAGFTKDNSNYVTGNATVTYKVPFVKGISLKSAFNIEQGNTYNKALQNPIPVYVPDVSSPFGYRQTGGFFTPKLTELWGRSTTYNLDVSINYLKLIGRHRVEALVLGTQNEMRGDYAQLFRDGIVGGLQIINAGSARNQTTSGASSQIGRVGYFARVNYEFADKYFAEFAVRSDGSTKFPEGHRWGYFPGGSIGWRISEEPFIKEKSKAINDLKIRASIGYAGSDNISANNYYYTYGIATQGSSASQGYIFGGSYSPSFFLNNNNVPNPQITWAKSLMTNLGFNFMLWDGKLAGTFDIYRKDVSDLPMAKSLSIPASFGIGAPLFNFAKERYTGYEFELSHTSKISRDLAINIKGTFTYSKGRVIDYGEPQSTPLYQKAEGYSPYKTTLYKAIGFFSSKEEINNWPINQDGIGNTSLKPGDVKYADLNGDKKIDANDQVVVNNLIFAPIGFGFSTSLKYKNFNIEIFFQGNAKNTVLFTPQTYSKERYDNRWTPQNQDAKYPRMSSSMNNSPIFFPSTLYMTDGSFMRLRNLQIGYAFPSSLMDKIGFKSLRIYASGTNLFTFTKLRGIDPEVPNVPGGTFGNYYPVQKSLGFGLNLGF